MRSTILAHKRAKQLRRRLTPPEVRLWLCLRRRRPGEPVFRRQHPFGVYILDFFCPAARLAVEIDGYVHGVGGQPAHDQRRDAWLRAQGLTVRRIAASDVMEDAEEMADIIRREARDMALSVLPRATGEGDHAQRGGGGGGRRGDGGDGVRAESANASETVAPSTAPRSPSPVARGRTG